MVDTIPKDVFSIILEFLHRNSDDYIIKWKGLHNIMMVSKHMNNLVRYHMSKIPLSYKLRTKIIKNIRKKYHIANIFLNRQIELDNIERLLLNKINDIPECKIKTNEWFNFFKLKRTPKLLRLLTRNFKILVEKKYYHRHLHTLGKPKEYLEGSIMRKQPHRFIIQIRKNWVIFRIKKRPEYF